MRIYFFSPKLSPAASHSLQASTQHPPATQCKTNPSAANMAIATFSPITRVTKWTAEETPLKRMYHSALQFLWVRASGAICLNKLQVVISHLWPSLHPIPIYWSLDSGVLSRWYLPLWSILEICGSVFWTQRERELSEQLGGKQGTQWAEFLKESCYGMNDWRLPRGLVEEMSSIWA